MHRALQQGTGAEGNDIQWSRRDSGTRASMLNASIFPSINCLNEEWAGIKSKPLITLMVALFSTVGGQVAAPSGEIPFSLTIYNQWLATDQWLARPTLDSIKAEEPTTLKFRHVSKTWAQISGLISVPFESHLIPFSCRKWRTSRTAENPGTLHSVSRSGNDIFFFQS